MRALYGPALTQASSYLNYPRDFDRVFSFPRPSAWMDLRPPHTFKCIGPFCGQHLVTPRKMRKTLSVAFEEIEHGESLLHEVADLLGADCAWPTVENQSFSTSFHV